MNYNAFDPLFNNPVKSFKIHYTLVVILNVFSEVLISVSDTESYAESSVSVSVRH